MSSDPYLDPRGYRPFNLENSLSNHENQSQPLAATADVLKVYEQAVQEPMVECINLDSLYCSAQLEDTDRPEARLLREDFSSSAIVASTWLSMSPKNTAQAVDIDFSALSDTLRRSRKGKARLLQSPSFSPTKSTREISLDEIESNHQGSSSKSEGPSGTTASNPPVNSDNSPSTSTSTWDEGATSERFERKFQARLKKQKQKKDKESSSKSTKKEDPENRIDSNLPRLTLLQSDVLELPVPPIPSSTNHSQSVHTRSNSPESELPPADLIASLNYAMCYFHSRSTLISYLKVALKTLRPKTGVFVTDLFGGPPTGEKYQDQKPLWVKFEKEVGFNNSKRDVRRKFEQDERALRETGSKTGRSKVQTRTDGDGSSGLKSEEADEEDRIAGKVEIFPAPLEGTKGTPAEWPRGKLKMVRKGTEHGGFEYWREDGPLDYSTNRFRMSLSFRFKDASWLRDVFSYDFRAYSVKELTEAMEEVGFVRVSVHVLPRNIVDQDSDSSSGGSDLSDQEDGDGMAAFLTRTEKEEKNRSSYRAIKEGEKLFADRSFSTYIVACAP